MKKTIDRWLLIEVPAARLATLRILVGSYALVFMLIRFRSFWNTADLPSRQIEGVGILWFLNGAVSPVFARVVFVAVLVLGIGFVIGYRFKAIGPIFALMFLVVATYRLSFGHVIHTEHLVALHLLILGFTNSGDAISWSHSPQRFTRPRKSANYGWPIQLMILATVLTYVLAGFAKLRHGGFDWLGGDILRNQVAYDNLRKELLGSPHSPLGGWLVGFAWLFPPAAVATTVVELGAIVALFGSIRWRATWAAAAWVFHVGVVATMAISFPYPLSFVAYAPLFAVEKLWSFAPIRRISSSKIFSEGTYL